MLSDSLEVRPRWRLTKEEEAWAGVLMGQSAQMWLKWTDSADNGGQRNSWEPLELVRSHSRADRLHTEGWSLKTEVHLIFSLTAEMLLWNAVKLYFKEVPDYSFISLTGHYVESVFICWQDSINPHTIWNDVYRFLNAAESQSTSANHCSETF